jgi:hypothetical protein
VLAAKQHVKELKFKRKHDASNPLSLVNRMNEYVRAMRRDVAELRFIGDCNVSTRDYRHEIVKRERYTSGRCFREPFGVPHPTVRYGVPKPKASDIPLYEVEDDEALAQAGFISFLMKIARQQRRKLSKKRLKQIARQKAAVVEAAERAAEYKAEVAENVSGFPIPLPPLPKKFTVGIVAHEVELCDDGCDGIGCNCGCHGFRKTVVE